jgi:4-amino-4-deoxy-L-arabinose transferase-like glycosyltransferase
MNTASTESGWWRDYAALALLFGSLFFFRLESYAPLSNPDEGRYAEIPREMVASGDWVTPRLDGVNYFEKPPLVYWVAAECLRLFGPGEGSMRTASAGFALWGVLLTYGATRKLYGREAGCAAAAVLGTSLFYFGIGHLLLLDMAVSVLISRTLFSFILGVREAAGPARRRYFYDLYISAALATLAKGLIGFLLTGAVMFLWLLILRQWKRLRPFYLPSGALLFLAIALPWHVMAAMRNPTWAHRYLVYEHFDRFLSPVASRPGPWWYFVPLLVGGLFPWIAFLWPAVRESVRGGWAKLDENANAWFLLIWAGLIFFFFSGSHSKLPPYILPVFPPLAVLIGVWLARAAEKGAEEAGAMRVFSGACVLLAVALGVVVVRPSMVNLAAQKAALLRPYAACLAAVLVTGAIFVPRHARRQGLRMAQISIVGMMILFLGILTYVAPYLAKPGTKPLALIVKERAGTQDAVVSYHEFFHDFPFYAGRTVDVAAFKGEIELEEDAAARESGRFMSEAGFRALWAGPGRVYAVARKSDVRELFSDNAFQYHLLGETEDHYLFSNQP